MSYQLESLAQMNNYYGWVMDEFSPFIGRRVLEIGAGNGNFSRMLFAAEKVECLWLVEPEQEYYNFLVEKFTGLQNIVVLKLSAEELTMDLLASLQLDTIVMVNVLEHIDDDVELLHRCSQALVPGGRLLTFSPAFPILYSNYDRLVGHCRRYRKKDLEGKFIAAGFSINHLKYFNFFGFFAWLLLVRLFRAETFGTKKLKLYEKIIGILQYVEQRIEFPLGQSIVAIGEKR